MRSSAEKYANDEWIRQRSPLADARGTAGLKTPEGFVRVYVGVHGDTIKSLLVAGDFNTMPAGVSRLEAALRWSPRRARADHRGVRARAEPERAGRVPRPAVAERHLAGDHSRARARAGGAPGSRRGLVLLPGAMKTLLPVLQPAVAPRRSPDWVRISYASAVALRFKSGRFTRDFDFGGINLLLSYDEGCLSDCGYCGLARTGPGSTRTSPSSGSSGRWSKPTSWCAVSRATRTASPGCASRW